MSGKCKPKMSDVGWCRVSLKPTLECEQCGSLPVLAWYTGAEVTNFAKRHVVANPDHTVVRVDATRTVFDLDQPT